MTNPDGVVVHFEPADLKALSGASYFFVEKYAQIGSSSQEGQRAVGQPNAAVFDLALRYFIAEKQKAFVIDSHLGEEVWNESVIGYERKLHSIEPLTDKEKVLFPTAAMKVKVSLVLKSLSEIDILESNKPTVAKVAAGQLHESTPMSYQLYLSSAGQAVDGTWDPTQDPAGLRGVDFVWFSAGRGTDSANPENNGNKNLYYRTIKFLMKKSVAPYTCQNLFFSPLIPR